MKSMLSSQDMSIMNDGKYQGGFFEEFTQTKSEPPSTCKRSVCVCVCVCVCVRARACMRACVCVHVNSIYFDCNVLLHFDCPWTSEPCLMPYSTTSYAGLTPMVGMGKHSADGAAAVPKFSDVQSKERFLFV